MALEVSEPGVHEFRTVWNEVEMGFGPFTSCKTANFHHPRP
jgi:hypothetical protein